MLRGPGGVVRGGEEGVENKWGKYILSNIVKVHETVVNFQKLSHFSNCFIFSVLRLLIKYNFVF